MAYRVDLTPRAARDLRQIYRSINASDSGQARVWFNGLERLISSLDEHPARGAAVPEDIRLRQVLYGRKPHLYRVIYAVDDQQDAVVVVHIRHGARDGLAAGASEQEGVSK